MRYILIPVKDLSKAKQRLTRIMSQEERTGLARLMMEQVFEQVACTRGYDRAAVITLYGPAIRLAKKLGFEIIREIAQVSESVSVDYGSRIARNAGATSVLRLPIDLPLIRAEDIEAVLSCASGCSGGRIAVVVPSRDGTGTNAISRTPPELFPSHFGPNSFEQHRAETRARGALFMEMRLPRIECDIDDADDIAYLLQHGRGSAAHEYLIELGIGERLRKVADSVPPVDNAGQLEPENVRRAGESKN